MRRGTSIDAAPWALCLPDALAVALSHLALGSELPLGRVFAVVTRFLEKRGASVGSLRSAGHGSVKRLHQDCHQNPIWV